MHIIQNFEALACPEHVEGAENDLRRDALLIAEAGYEAININAVIRSKVQVASDEMSIGDKTYQLAGRRVFFVGIGKCALTAASAIEKLFGDTLTGGIVFDVSTESLRKSDIHSSSGCPTSSSKIEVFIGTHPLPSEVNEHATKRIIEFLSDCREDDLVIFLISGGGSTLLCSPEAPMASADESALFKELTARGATIQDINTVRKHISSARGGGLARAAYPAEIVSLIVSDVPGNDMAFISSGPTVKDQTSVNDAKEILGKYTIIVPTNTTYTETPKEEKYFERVNNILFLTSEDALTAMKDSASKHGYDVEIVDEQFSGEARDIGRAVVEKLHNASPKTALLYAGESTVTLTDTECPSNSGGRNQEMALAALEYLNADELILPLASDGHDNTDRAGAIGDAITLAHAQEKNLSVSEYLDAHRSYEFFSTAGDALNTGYTGSNISDLIIALKK
ncbi:MAG: DUF4147 domain-containing protein [Candidatus Paceibacterota bacterium]|jgi:glycerate-2-kinase